MAWETQLRAHNKASGIMWLSPADPEPVRAPYQHIQRRNLLSEHRATTYLEM